MPKAKQISAWVENRPGMLGKVADALGAKKVDIRAFMAASLEGKGFLRVVVDKPAAARRVFTSLGWKTTVDDLVEVVVADRPGALGRVADRLGAAGINIHYGYLGTARRAGRASLFLAVDDPKAALRALRK
ncbi:MAG TPA: ACT domain-containing protein [Anaeromyxobacteraceae bacterium]|nr:ACT domain-containing protein [Anaeromyxobacteraceae bacterium]